MAAGAADGLFRYLCEGSLSCYDMGIQRRPYHQNCQCALHNKSRESCHHTIVKCKTVSYPIRRSWSEGNLALVAASTCHSLPSSLSSLQGVDAGWPQPVVLNEQEEKVSSLKV